jgi:hypothetical protein
MPRNRYTKAVREQEQALLARQEKELSTVARNIRCGNGESAVAPPINEAKKHRRARLKHKCRHKSERSDATGTGQL